MIHSYKLKKYCHNIALIGIAFMIYSCAAVSSPGGGPLDETPPDFISAIPEAGSLRFEGGKITLKFSEYIDKKSLKNSIKISPRLNTPIELIYDDDEISLNFPENLLKDQTYVVTINRNLKDERGVALEQSIQVAYSTGAIIDEGEISGRIYGKEAYAVHLWKLEKGFEDSLFFTEPLYVSEADDEGNFKFKYLGPGDYVIICIERGAAGAKLVPQRMAYGVTSKKIYSLAKNESLNGITMRPNREKLPIKLTHGEWKGKRWGWMYFNRELEGNIVLNGVTIIDSDEKVYRPRIYKDTQDQKRFLLISPDTILAGKAVLKLSSVFSSVDTILANSKINFRIPAKSDTIHLKRTKPESLVSIQRNKDGGPIIPIVFSKPVISISDSAFFIVTDTDTVMTKVNWVNPMEIAFIPPNGWKEKTIYKLIVFSEGLTPIEGKTLKDSIAYVNIKSEKKLGYGGLSGSIEMKDVNLLMELKTLKKEPKFFYSTVNSEQQFHFKYIPEGPYRLTLIDDRDRNGKYSYGIAYPFQASEWFNIYPDTFDVRANWDIDVGSLRIGKKN